MALLEDVPMMGLNVAFIWAGECDIEVSSACVEGGCCVCTRVTSF